MKLREIRNNVFAGGAVDWDRRLFDSLIPLPDGTSYNSYLIKGSEKTVLLDTVEPAMLHVLMGQLEEVDRIDYLISHHAEQDHSGTIPNVLEKYKTARLVTSIKGRDMIIDHLRVPAERIVTVNHKETLSLGGKTLEFVLTPWVHWPETMCTYLREDKILFSCDFFGSHLATSELFATDKPKVYESAKRYYAEIMMPFRQIIKKNLEILGAYEIDMIAPSHGPIYAEPSFIINGYKDWISDQPKNEAVIIYATMHGSTRILVERLVGALAEKKVKVSQFDLAVTDIGKLAIALVDAATLVIGTPTVNMGPHPAVMHAANLANCIKPKFKFASVIGSYGWSQHGLDKITALIPNLKPEILEPVLCKGMPRDKDLEAIDRLASNITEKHRGIGLM